MVKKIPAMAGTISVLLLLLATTASADEGHDVSFAELGPVDLSGHGDIPNVGEHVALGSVELDADVLWDVTASVRLVVEDPEGPGKPALEQKNSQGCALIANGGQVGGAGGSSSLWTPFDGGKDVVFTSWWNGTEFLDVVPVQGPATVSLECFIDASHSGVVEADRSGMAATDIEISAVREVEPEDETTPDPTETSEPEPSETSTPSSPEPTTTPAAASDTDTLPETGAGARALVIIGASMVLLGGGVMLGRRLS